MLCSWAAGIFVRPSEWEVCLKLLTEKCVGEKNIEVLDGKKLLNFLITIYKLMVTAYKIQTGVDVVA